MRAASLIVTTYHDVFKACDSDVSQLGTKIALPVFSQDVIRSLCREYIKSKMFFKSVIHVFPDRVNIVGDLHGNIHNLFTIFTKNGYPPKSKYLFLGNLVEFGEFSLEVVTLLIAYQTLYPHCVNILKGVTEANSLFIYRGLQSDIVETYHNMEIYELWLQVFQRFPIGAFIFDTVLCTQPCWIPKFNDMESLEQNFRQTEVARDADAYNYITNEFCQFDEEMLKKVKTTMNLDYLILGSCPDGVFYDTVGDAIFISACNCDSGCYIPLYVNQQNEVQVFEAFEVVERNKCNFRKIKETAPANCIKGKICIPSVRSGPRVFDINPGFCPVFVQKTQSAQEVKTGIYSV